MKKRFLELDELNAVPGDAYRTFPLVIEAEGTEETDPLPFFHDVDFDDLLSRHGAVLFRGFELSNPGVDEALAALDASFSIPTIGNQTLRHKVSQRTANSTGAPRFYYIPQHIEWNYNGRLPGTLAFYCEHPPESDGSTVIADNRNLTKQLPDSIMDKLDANYLYQFTFSSEYTAGDLLTYFDAEREEDAYARMHELGFAMRDDLEGVMQSVRSCLIRHPRTNDVLLAMPLEYMYKKVLKNGMFNVRKFNRTKRLKYLTILAVGRILEIAGKKTVPSRIVFEDRALTRREYRDYLNILNANKVFFTWRRGDLLLLDNLLVTHGKQPHTGKRKIIVSMGALLDRNSLALSRSAEREAIAPAG